MGPCWWSNLHLLFVLNLPFHVSSCSLRTLSEAGVVVDVLFLVDIIQSYWRQKEGKALRPVIKISGRVIGGSLIGVQAARYQPQSSQYFPKDNGASYVQKQRQQWGSECMMEDEAHGALTILGKENAHMGAMVIKALRRWLKFQRFFVLSKMGHADELIERWKSQVQFLSQFGFNCIKHHLMYGQQEL